MSYIRRFTFARNFDSERWIRRVLAVCRAKSRAGARYPQPSPVLLNLLKNNVLGTIDVMTATDSPFQSLVADGGAPVKSAG